MALVLLVDDEPLLRSVLCEYLKFAGHEVIECKDGDEALGRLAERPVDVVVSDVLMPGMDGIGLCGALRADEKTRGLPFVFVTARSIDEEMQEEMDRIGDASVLKPFEPQTLLQAISLAIQKRARE
ncbi:MAG TPA: response regulator [Candidatus Acidoferrales bacterium]|nr:response regulator [Candidatus Acidoferrales bacterium]